MDFNKYKNRLFDYLQYKKLEPVFGLNKCINPNHADKNPSCLFSKNIFHCYSCGVSGDIYDAVGLLEGIEGKVEQFQFIDKLFGGAE